MSQLERATLDYWSFLKVTVSVHLLSRCAGSDGGGGGLGPHLNLGAKSLTFPALGFLLYESEMLLEAEARIQ